MNKETIGYLQNLIKIKLEKNQIKLDNDVSNEEFKLQNLSFDHFDSLNN